MTARLAAPSMGLVQADDELDKPRTMWEKIGPDDPEALKRVLRKREMIGYGGYGVVYKVGDAAVKIGYVTAEEADRQDYVHKNFRLALPVIRFLPSMRVPMTITRAVCPLHGVLGYDEDDGWSCHCGERMGVLVMPLAEPFDPQERAARREEIVNDTVFVMDLFQDEQGFVWDDRPSNIMKWRGRPVLIDFGEEEVDFW